ncbi:MAG: biotin synthase BioB [Thermodesulfovibrio sp.]|nr:biotin synthase BioB [Thermodesulfovibrio sp.]
MSGIPIIKSDAIRLTKIQKTELPDLFSSANRIREAFSGDMVDLCAIVNAKSGACPEDCSYCAQSSKSKADIIKYPLLKKEKILKKTEEAKDGGVKRFSIVTSGKKVSKNELKEIAFMIEGIKNIGLLPCASLGLLGKDELLFLKAHGLDRYHHNIETSERFFPHVCKTHTYSDKLKTLEAAQAAGLSVCSGGIFGMGETWEDRIDMAFFLKELGVDSVPVNFLIPIKGTPLSDRELLDPFEALKIISLFRFILPHKAIRICGGRVQVLGESGEMIFTAGADSLMTGNYLTTTGRTFEDDLRFIRQHGLKVA